jgi:class 3 adenylate cyclase
MTQPESTGFKKVVGHFANLVNSKYGLPILLVTLVLLFLLSLTGAWLIDRTLLRILPIFIIPFIIMTFLGYFLTRQISRRVRRVIEAAEKVAQGDFSIRVMDRGSDEIGQLGQAFNKMVIDLENLEESRNLLSRTMSPDVRQSLIQHGLDFRGIVKTVSILFIDIRDFTRLTEIHNTEQLVFFLNDYYTTIAKQVHIEGGIIGKYGGDSIIAYFGALDSKPPAETSVAALLSALALLEAITDLSRRWAILGIPAVRVGIGISIGPVVAGPIGSVEQFEYTVIGDAVNLASRLQNLTRNINGFDIILSKEVHDALSDMVKSQIRVVDYDTYKAMTEPERAKNFVQFVDLGEVLVKGKKGPVQVYGFPDLDRQRDSSARLA